MTPESALGRLINLREDWQRNAGDMTTTFLEEESHHYVLYTAKEWGSMNDDLDDIIRSIQRSIHNAGGTPQLEPDSDKLEPYCKIGKRDCPYVPDYEVPSFKPSDESSYPLAPKRCPDCDEPLFCGVCASEPPDSEDTERRKKGFTAQEVADDLRRRKR